MRHLLITPLPGIEEVTEGTDLPALLGRAIRQCGRGVAPQDILVVAQKIVSKREGRLVDLNSVRPSARAEQLAQLTGKDARLVEVVLSESSEVLRAVPGVLVVRHRLGYVMANAGIDRSNVPGDSGAELVLLLPRDPDGSAERLRTELQRRFAIDAAVIVSDSFGRPWRRGVTNVALGCAGLPALIDKRGERDRNGRPLQTTEVAFADAVAAAAGLIQGEAAESTPAVLVQGLGWSAPACTGATLVRPLETDLFR